MKPLDDPRLKLVLIDDHDGARNALVRRLAGHEHLFVAGHTADPYEGRSLVQSVSPHVALVDPVRSDHGGNQILSSLAALPGHLRPLVVVHLAFFDAALWNQARKAGADDVVLKLIDVDTLASRLMAAAAEVLPRARWPSILR